MPAAHAHFRRNPCRLGTLSSGSGQTEVLSDIAQECNEKGGHGQVTELVQKLDVTPFEQLSQPEVELLERVYASYG